MYEDYLDMVEHSVEPYTEEEYEENIKRIAEEHEKESVSLQQNEQLNTENNGQGINQAGGTGGSVVVSETGQAGAEGSAVGNEGQGSIQEAGSEGTGNLPQEYGEVPVNDGRGDSSTQMAMRDSVRKEVGGRSNEEGGSKGHLEGVGGTVVNDDEPSYRKQKQTQRSLPRLRSSCVTIW